MEILNPIWFRHKRVVRSVLMTAFFCKKKNKTLRLKGTQSERCDWNNNAKCFHLIRTRLC